MLSRAYQSGLPVLPPRVVDTVTTGLTVLAAVLTLLYVGYHLNLWRTSRPVSLRKLTMMGIFLGATYYLYVFIDDFLVGFTVWSAFHCIQYYGIVWAFNQNRVARKSPVTAFVNFLFRPRLGLAALYGGLILAYGSLNLLPGVVGDEMLRRLMIAFIFTSNSLHYYYDGFIWKVRDRQTRDFLSIASVEEAGRRGLAAAKATVARAVRGLRPANNGILQVAYLGAIVIALAAFEVWRPNTDVAMTQSLAASSPTVGEAQYNLGNALWRSGQLNRAIETYLRAAEQIPDSSKVYNNLGGALADAGRVDEALEAYRRALELRREHDIHRNTTSGSPLMPGSAHSEEAGLGVIHGNLADALARSGKPAEALEHYRQALAATDRRDPALARIYAGYGATLAELGRYEEGAEELRQALLIDPDYASAHINLGSLLDYLGQRDQARLHYETALRSTDERARRAAEAALVRLSSQP
jgi:tetratricopeptide (TPR) repeat protein